jgi:hypothetical protein
MKLNIKQGCQVAAVTATFLKCGSLKNYGRGKFEVVSCRRVAVKVPEMLKCGCKKLFLKIPKLTDRNSAAPIKCARFLNKLFSIKFAMHGCKEVLKHTKNSYTVHFIFGN